MSVDRLIAGLAAKTVIFVGNYGSGKSEVAVNFSLRARELRDPVSIIDLDIVNPYFRCREARDLMRSRAIDVIIPPGDQVYADLPIIVPQVKSILERPRGLIVLDVGGDDLGARVLGSFKGVIDEADYAMWMVLNRSRPFTEDVDGALRIMREIEHASRLPLTGIVANSHLMEFTTPATIENGYALAREVGARLGLPVVFVAVEQSLAPQLDSERFEAPLFPISRHLLPPWLVRPGSRVA